MTFDLNQSQWDLSRGDLTAGRWSLNTHRESREWSDILVMPIRPCADGEATLPDLYVSLLYMHRGRSAP